MLMRIVLPAFLIIASGAFFVAQHIMHIDMPRYTFGTTDTAFAEASPEHGSVLFVGDIMLGRGVETRMEEAGPSYPFVHITSFVQPFDLAVGNFEASVPKEHQKTPDFKMQFSVKQEYLGQVYQSGFDVLSLANNHSLDYGSEGYQNTVESCEYYKLTCFGHPQELNPYSLHYQDLEETRIGVLALHTITDAFDPISLGALLERMNFYSDIQVVYVHWGEEYIKEHNEKQERLAKRLIDNGVDAVIGHHPHVVQDIEFYKDKPIFYSLGNFIFDQYFDNDVQTGLAVAMTLSDETVGYTLHGITSVTSKSQPQRMSREAQSDFLDDLSVTTDTPALETAVRNGYFSVPR